MDTYTTNQEKVLRTIRLVLGDNYTQNNNDTITPNSKEHEKADHSYALPLEQEWSAFWLFIYNSVHWILILINQCLFMVLEKLLFAIGLMIIIVIEITITLSQAIIEVLLAIGKRIWNGQIYGRTKRQYSFK